MSATSRDDRVPESRWREAPVTPEVRDGVVRFAQRSFGLRLAAPLDVRLDDAIRRAMELCSEPDAHTLLLRAQGLDPRATDALASALRVGETSVFRDEACFAFVRDLLSREHLTRPRVLRVLSAGCSTGEEVWSLAATAVDALGPHTAQHMVKVTGVDFDDDALAIARAGVYRAWAFRETSPAVRDRWFDATDAGWVVKPELRSIVRFARQNLAEAEAEPPPERYDLVLCRNVLLYFTPEAIAHAARFFAASLVEGGWLLTSPTDPPIPPDHGLVRYPLEGVVAYRRRSEHASATSQSGVFARPSEVSTPSIAPGPKRSLSPSAGLRLGTLPPASSQIARARALADAGCPEQSRRALDATVQSARTAEYFLLRGALAQSEGRMQDALQQTAMALTLDPNLPTAYVIQATAHARLGATGPARAALVLARSMLARLAPGAAVPYAGSVTAAELLSSCDRLSRALDASPHRPGGGHA